MSTISIEEFLGKPLRQAQGGPEKTIGMEEFLGGAPSPEKSKPVIEPEVVARLQAFSERPAYGMGAMGGRPVSGFMATAAPKTQVQRILDDRDEREREEVELQTAGMSAQRRKGPEEAGEIEDDPQTRMQKALDSFQTGGAGLIDLVGGGMIWAGLEETGAEVRDYAQRVIKNNEVKELYKEFEWSDMADPDFYLTKGVQMVPSLLTLIPLAVGGGVVGGAIAGGLGAGALVGSIAGAVASAVASRPLESAMEAAGTFNSLLDQGATREQASEAAADVFTKNMALIGMDAAQFALAFAKVPASLRKGMAGWIRRAGPKAVGFATGAVSEGYEEVLQGYFQELGEQSLKGEVDASILESLKLAGSEAKEAFVLGTIGGAAFQTVGTVKQALSPKETDTIIQEQIDNAPGAEVVPEKGTGQQVGAEYPVEYVEGKPKEPLKGEVEYAETVRETPGPVGEGRRAVEAGEKAGGEVVRAEVREEPAAPIRPEVVAKPREGVAEVPVGGVKPEIRPELPVKVLPEVPSAAKEPVEGRAAKQPWEMTRGEYTAYAHDLARKHKSYEPPYLHRGLQEWHQDIVAQAVREGKPVPAAVLAEYPDLARQEAGQAVKPPPSGGISTTEAVPKEGVVFAQGEYVKEPETKPVEGVIKPGAGVEGEIIGLNVDEIARLRKELSLDDLDSAQRRTWERTLGNAKQSGADASALELAAELINFRRPITDTEHAGMVLKAAGLANEYDRVIKDVNDLIEKGDGGGARFARHRAEFIVEQIDRLTEATKLGRREAARALSIGRMMIYRETYALAHVMQRAQAAKGKKLSPEETDKIERIVAEHSELQKKLKKTEDDYAKLLAEKDRQAAEKVIMGKISRAKGRKASLQEQILAERENIKKQIAALGYRVNDISGVTTEGAYLVGKLAVNYIRGGASTLSGVVKKVRADVPELTEQDVYQSLITKDPKIQRKARTDAQRLIANLKAQAELLLKIEKAEKGVFDLPKKQAPQSSAVRVLQIRLRNLRGQAYRSGAHPEQLEKAIKTINEIQDQIANFYRPLRRPKPEAIAELASAKEKIRELRRMMRVEDDLARLKEQLRTGDFEIREKPAPKEVPPDLERKQIELKRVRGQIQETIDGMAPVTAGRVGVEAINTLRTLKATADMSAVLRQGLILSVMRPRLAAKAFVKAGKSFFYEYTAEQVEEAIYSADQHYLREKAGLYVAPLGPGKLGKREEMFMAQWIEKVPAVGTVVKASARHMTTYLNMVRVAVFDEFLIKNPNATQEELVAWADWINVSTGRGNLGRAAAIANTLSLGFFAPRFAISRVQTPYRIFKHWKTPRVRKAIARDFVGLVGLGSLALALADLIPGVEVGLDPRDPDFGKIRIGKTRIDIWGGVQQPVRVVWRIGLAVTDRAGITGKELTDQEKNVDPLDLVGRFAEYKLGPAVTVPLEFLKGKTIVGEPVTPSMAAARVVVPMWIDDVADAYRLSGVPRAVAVGGLTFFGVGANTYEDSEFKTRRRIRRLKIVGNYTAADNLKFEWNLRNPDNKIISVSVLK